MDFTEKTIKKEYMYKGRIINLRKDEIELPDGKPSDREVVEHNGGVAVLALSEDNEIFMVNQYRYPYSEVLTEIPAGKLEKGEDPLEAGKRELMEETGLCAENYRSLGKLYPTPGYCAEIIHMYLATGLSYGECCPDEDEFLSVVKMPLSEVVKMVVDGRIKDAKTQTAVLKTAIITGGIKI